MSEFGIDFDVASAKWRENKKSTGNGTFKYIWDSNKRLPAPAPRAQPAAMPTPMRITRASSAALARTAAALAAAAAAATT